MERRAFEKLVAEALAGLPLKFRRRLNNVEIIIEDEPTLEDLEEAGVEPPETILGLYRGIPLTERSTSYGLVMPDTITIYQKPIGALCRTPGRIKREIQRVVMHEIAHYFGLTDERLDELGI